MKLARTLRWLGAGAALGLAASVAPVQAQGNNWDKIVAAAKKEGTLVLYASTTGSMHQAVISDFQKKFGIKIELVGGRGNEFAERIRTEQIAGRYNGDVTINGQDTLISHQKRGNLQPHGDLPNLATLPSSVKTDNTIVPAFYGPFAIFINTNLVKPADEPKKWADLLDPKWKKKIILDDPRVISSGNAFFRAMVFNYGNDYAAKLKAQDPVISLDVGGSQRRVLLGEYPILVPDDFKFYIDELAKGGRLPVKIVIPEQGVVASRFDAGMLKNAPHPNAANLFLNFLLSPDAQLDYARQGRVPIIKKGVLDKLAPQVRPLLSTPVLPMPPGTEQQKYLKMAQQVFGH